MDSDKPNPQTTQQQPVSAHPVVVRMRNGRGNPSIRNIDLDEVRRLASQGLPKALIAKGLGIDERTLQRIQAGEHDWIDAESFVSAIEQGQHDHRMAVLSTLNDLAINKRNLIASIFLSKQREVLGFTDRPEDTRISGEIKLTVTTRLISAALPKKDKVTAVDAEYTEVE